MQPLSDTSSTSADESHAEEHMSLSQVGPFNHNGLLTSVLRSVSLDGRSARLSFPGQ